MNVIDFYFFLLSWKSSLQQRVQSWKFKILLWIQNQSLLSQILNNANSYLSTFSAKINDKFLKLTKTPIFVVILAQRGFFQKTLAKYNCSGPSAFKCQRYRVEQNIIPSISTCKNHSINSLNSSNHLWDITGLRIPWYLRPRPFLATSTR